MQKLHKSLRFDGAPQHMPNTRSRKEAKVHALLTQVNASTEMMDTTVLFVNELSEKLCDHGDMFALFTDAEELVHVMQLSGDENFLTRDLPINLTSAIDDPVEGKEWNGAWQKELGNFVKHECLDFENPITLTEARSQGYEVLKSKDVLKRKTYTHPETLRLTYSKHKVRWCAKELKGERGKITHAPVAREESVRIMISYWFQCEMFTVQGDIESAFLQGKHPYKTVIQPPPDRKMFDPVTGEEQGLILIGNMYGTTTAGNIFYVKHRTTLLKIGFIPFQSDPAVYSLVMDTERKEVCTAFTHVDDDAFGSKWRDLLEWVFARMREVFSMTGPDPLDTFSGLNVVVDNGCLMIHGIPWLIARLTEFGLMDDNGKPRKEMVVSTPWTGLPIDKESPKLYGVEKQKVQHMIGCSIYAAYKYRPDLQPSSVVAASQMQSPTVQTSEMVLRQWRYVLGSLQWVVGTRRNRKCSSCTVLYSPRS